LASRCFHHLEAFTGEHVPHPTGSLLTTKARSLQGITAPPAEASGQDNVHVTVGKLLRDCAPSAACGSVRSVAKGIEPQRF